MLEADIDKSDEKTVEISREINRFIKVIHRRRHKNRKHRELSLRVNELKSLKIEVRNIIDAVKQIISHIEEAKDLVNFKIKELGK